MNETLSDSHEVTHMVYVVISASLHPVFSHFVLFPHRPSLFLPPLLRCLCPCAADTPHQRCCHSDRGHMLDATSTTSKNKTKQEMHPKGGTRTCTVTALCKCLSVICKKKKKKREPFKCICTNTACRCISGTVMKKQEAVWCTGVTGSSSPRLTNRYNQLS